MKEDSVIRNKSMEFSVRMVKLNRFLQRKKEYKLADQVLRSGTAIGALVREAEYAESKLDFIHKMRIALKEANETSYWLDLFSNTEILDETAYTSIRTDVEELKKMLVCIINTSRASL